LKGRGGGNANITGSECFSGSNMETHRYTFTQCLVMGPSGLWEERFDFLSYLLS